MPKQKRSAAEGERASTPKPDKYSRCCPECGQLTNVKRFFSLFCYRCVISFDPDPPGPLTRGMLVIK